MLQISLFEGSFECCGFCWKAGFHFMRPCELDWTSTILILFCQKLYETSGWRKWVKIHAFEPRAWLKSDQNGREKKLNSDQIKTLLRGRVADSGENWEESSQV